MASGAGPRSDPSHDVYTGESQPLDALFKPRSVALVGASEREGSVGRQLMWNLLSSPFGGTVFPVNPKRPQVLGVQAYPSVRAVPGRVDLVVITTPADSVPGVIDECLEKGVPTAIVISAGFKEAGAHGRELEQAVASRIRGRLRLVGPNCLGVMNPVTGMNATFAQTHARPGNIAFLSQSGALCTAVLDWSLTQNVGFSAFVSVGSMLDVGWGDLISYFGDDARTRAILIYMESIGDARAFLSAAREVSLTKPILVIKAGRTAAAAHAAASHTGALTGSDEVLDAAFRRCGVLRVKGIEDIFYMADVLAKQPRPAGRRLAIVTNAGGPGVLATDALIAGGGQLAPLAPETQAELDAFLPAQWSHGNPVDILGDAEPERYAKAVASVSKDPNADGLLVILTPQGMTHPTQTAQSLKRWSTLAGKPILASWMGGADVAAGDAILTQAGVPTFRFPDTAVRAFNYLWRYADNLQGLYETPVLNAPAGEPSSPQVRSLLDEAQQAGRTLLTEYESKRLLALYGIPTVETRMATSVDEAVAHAQSIGFPVVLKLLSLTVTHKSDVGGVELDLRDETAVRAAYSRVEAAVGRTLGPGHFDGVTVQPMVKSGGIELILGSSVDPQFGPVLLFGAGGSFVEVFRDRALALPPLTSTLARRMMEQTKVWSALQGVRGRAPVDLAALEQLLVRFAALVVELPRVREVDLNPLLASDRGLLALDARVVLYGPDVPRDQIPRPAIRPYPSQYVAAGRLKNGEPVTFRPIRPEDEPLVVRFHERLSERSVYLRYFSPFKLSQRVAHERLTRICFIDYDRDMALVAVQGGPGKEEVLAIGRLARRHGTGGGELAALVRDEFQHQGLGAELYRRLIGYARDEKLAQVWCTLLQENAEMRAICLRLGFVLQSAGDGTLRAELALGGTAAS